MDPDPGCLPLYGSMRIRIRIRNNGQNVNLSLLQKKDILVNDILGKKCPVGNKKKLYHGEL